MAGGAQLILLSNAYQAGASAFKNGWRSIVGDGHVLSKFSASAEESLGKDVAKYLKSLRRGNVKDPLNKNNVFMSTWTTPETKSVSGKTIFPADRMLGIDVPVDAYSSMGLTLSCKNGEVTVDIIKDAIKELRKVAKNALKIGDIGA